MAISVNSITAKGVKMSMAPAGFDPVTFWAGYGGGFWDFTNPANLFANTSLTTPATLNAVGGVLGVTDLSGLNHPLVQPLAGTSFTMRSGYCESNYGGLVMNTTQSIGNQYTAIALFRPTSIGSTQNLVDTDYGSDTNRVAQNLWLWSTGVMGGYIFDYTSPAVLMPSPTLSAGTDYYSASATDNTNTRVSVAGTTYTSADGGILTGGGVPVAVGASYGGTLNPIYQQFTGRLYCAAYITKKCTPAEITDIGNYMNTLAGTSATI
jgi:hypothetical protein